MGKTSTGALHSKISNGNIYGYQKWVKRANNSSICNQVRKMANSIYYIKPRSN